MGFLGEDKYGGTLFARFPPPFGVIALAALAKFQKLEAEGSPVQSAGIPH